jgi:hypothetical protein
MATTIDPTNMTVTLTENVSLGDRNFGSTQTMNIADVAEVYKRIVTVPASGSGVMEVIATTAGTESAVEKALFDVTKIKYMRITNLMTAAGEGVKVHIARDDDSDDTDEEGMWYLLEEGKSFILHSFNATFNAGVDLNTMSVEDISVVRLQSEATAETDIEIMVALGA